MGRGTWRRRLEALRPAGEAAWAGLALGASFLFDDVEVPWILLAVPLAGFLLGLRHAGRGAWTCWAPLSVAPCWFVAAAPALGLPLAYWLAGSEDSSGLVVLAFPAGYGLAAGALVRRGLAAFGWFRRPGGPPLRLLPGSPRGWLVAVGIAAVVVAVLRPYLRDASELGLPGVGLLVRLVDRTEYAPGFDEGRFRMVRDGMTVQQVEALLGPPIERFVAGYDERWSYAREAPDRRDHEKRVILFRQGKVLGAVSGTQDE